MPRTPNRSKGPLSRRPGARDLLSTGDVAQACGVTRDGVLHWIHSGKLPAFRTPGGHFRIRRDDLSVFLRQSGCQYTATDTSGTASILVVDDEPMICELLEELLAQCGYKVRTAPGPNEALEMVRESSPDLVITDLALPDGGGARLTRTLRESPALSAVPVIAITGSFDDDRVEEIYRAGADLLISKPFQSQHLLGEVRRLLSAPAAIVPAITDGPAESTPSGADDDGRNGGDAS